MHCPSCEHPLEEHSAACPGCGFTLGRVDALFPEVPALAHPLTDTKRVLRKRERHALTRRVADFEERLPPLRLSVLRREAPPGVPRGVYLFWLFNRCDLHSPMERAGRNHHLLLWLQPEQKRLAIMPGYGLEPLVPDSALAAALAAAAPCVASGRFAQGLAACIERLQDEFERLHAQLPRVFGWAPEESWSPIEAEHLPVSGGACPDF